MTTLKPFSDDAASLSIGKLTIENGIDQMSIYGSLDIHRDQHGLARARQLKALLDAAVAVLEGQVDLPQELPKAEASKTVRNPFS